MSNTLHYESHNLIYLENSKIKLTSVFSFEKAYELRHEEALGHNINIEIKESKYYIEEATLIVSISNPEEIFVVPEITVKIDYDEYRLREIKLFNLPEGRLSNIEIYKINSCYQDPNSTYIETDDIDFKLNRFWNSNIHPSVNNFLIQFSRDYTPWNIILSETFLKSIKKVDKKIQGRILEAISKLSTNPDLVVGNTVKPLTGDKNGLWRYRIGDYRLIYNVENDAQKIELMSFDSRGNVYK